jgi:hypothetical protein
VTVAETANIVGASGTLGMGGLGLFLPRLAARITGLSAHTAAGRSEFRATFGGLLVALGAIPLLSSEPIAYALAGGAWLAAALGRVGSIMADRAGERGNAVAVGVEAIFAAALLVGSPGAALVAAIG